MTSKLQSQDKIWITNHNCKPNQSIARQTTSTSSSQNARRNHHHMTKDEQITIVKPKANRYQWQNTSESPSWNARRIMTISRQITSKLQSQNKRWSKIAREMKLQQSKWNNEGNKNLGEHSVSPVTVFLSKYCTVSTINSRMHTISGYGIQCVKLLLSFKRSFNWRKNQETGFLHEAHKSSGRISFAQHFSLLGTTITNQQFNYNGISFHLYGRSSSVLRPRTEYTENSSHFTAIGFICCSRHFLLAGNIVCRTYGKLCTATRINCIIRFSTHFFDCMLHSVL